MSIGPVSDDPVSSHARLDQLLTRCTFAPRGTAVRCALSGGPDSTALVALAVAADLQVTAVHVNHGLRSDADRDADAAASTAQHFGIPFVLLAADVPAGGNLEARARSARRSLIGPGALTGHTADDQAETVLLALIRGSGSSGLAGMQPSPTKPLLALRRHETHALCKRLGLETTEDSTNSDLRFRRNRIRHEVLPLLDAVAERDVTVLIDRAATLLRDDSSLLDELASQLDPTDARALARAPTPLARRAVRRWVVEVIDHELRHPPDAAGVERILAVARGEAAGCDVGGGWRVERSRQQLRLFRSE